MKTICAVFLLFAFGALCQAESEAPDYSQRMTIPPDLKHTAVIRICCNAAPFNRSDVSRDLLPRVEPERIDIIRSEGHTVILVTVPEDYEVPDFLRPDLEAAALQPVIMVGAADITNCIVTGGEGLLLPPGTIAFNLLYHKPGKYTSADTAIEREVKRIITTGGLQPPQADYTFQVERVETRKIDDDLTDGYTHYDFEIRPMNAGSNPEQYHNDKAWRTVNALIAMQLVKNVAKTAIATYEIKLPLRLNSDWCNSVHYCPMPRSKCDTAPYDKTGQTRCRCMDGTVTVNDMRCEYETTGGSDCQRCEDNGGQCYSDTPNGPFKGCSCGYTSSPSGPNDKFCSRQHLTLHCGKLPVRRDFIGYCFEAFDSEYHRRFTGFEKDIANPNKSAIIFPQGQQHNPACKFQLVTADTQNKICPVGHYQLQVKAKLGESTCGVNYVDQGQKYDWTNSFVVMTSIHYMRTFDASCRYPKAGGAGSWEVTVHPDPDPNDGTIVVVNKAEFQLLLMDHTGSKINQKDSKLTTADLVKLQMQLNKDNSENKWVKRFWVSDLWVRDGVSLEYQLIRRGRPTPETEQPWFKEGQLFKQVFNDVHRTLEAFNMFVLSSGPNTVSFRANATICGNTHECITVPFRFMGYAMRDLRSDAPVSPVNIELRDLRFQVTQPPPPPSTTTPRTTGTGSAGGSEGNSEGGPGTALVLGICGAAVAVALVSLLVAALFRIRRLSLLQQQRQSQGVIDLQKAGTTTYCYDNKGVTS